jgi:4,5-dihydroxyphthalate decarboxylase
MTLNRLTFAASPRYALKFLIDGSVQVGGLELAFPSSATNPGPFFRDLTLGSYDIGENAFSHYLIAKDSGKPLTAIPFFPSYFFPQLGVSVNRESGIRSPVDLVGKRVGAPDFGYNPAAWMRGILAHQYQVPTEKINWIEVEGDHYGLNYTRSERFQIERVQASGGGRTAYGLQPLLQSKAIDAVFFHGIGIMPTATTKKLFDDPYQEIKSYVGETGVLPINTVITVKEDVVKSCPDLPQRLMAALREASRLYEEETLRTGNNDFMELSVDWLRELGFFPPPQGLGAPNHRSVRMMIQYCYEQGLIRNLYEPKELFAAVR